jgi:phosphate transport system permease protein
MPSPEQFTGRQRRRVTRWTVALSDRLARIVIAIGGIGTIVAVSLVCVFLAWVVVPLFLPAAVEPAQALKKLDDGSNLIALGIDDYRILGWTIHKGGAIRVFRLDTGEIVESMAADMSPVAGVRSAAIDIDGHTAALGMDDGFVRLGQIGFDEQIIPENDATDSAKGLTTGKTALLGDGAVVTRTEQGELRRQKFTLTVQPPLNLGFSSPIARLDFVSRPDGTRLCTLSADGTLRVNLLDVRHDALTEEVQTDLTGASMPLPKTTSGPPDYVLISELGDSVFAAWRDGHLLRFDTRNVEQPRLMEETDLVLETGHSLTGLQFLLGRNTLVAGDSLGRVRAWFLKEAHDEGRLADEIVPPDGRVLVAAHEFPAAGVSVTSIAPSPRSRLVAVGFDDGQVRLLYPAAERTLADLQSGQSTRIDEMVISPKGDAILAISQAGMTHWDFDARHPEATLGMLFLPVWYEGYQRPEHAWQSTGASNASEAKLGLMPLVFGTLKATFYTMLFGAPLALLAAVYSSEFLHPRTKSRVKPMIEMMASLPSVVLGFFAGLILAPFVEGIVPQVLTCMFTVPLSFLLGAYVWQLLPGGVVVRLSRFRLFFILAMLPLGILLGMALGPVVEQWLFAGNIKDWLDHQTGNATGGWLLLFLPLTGLLTAVVFARQVNPRLRRRCIRISRTQAGFVELSKFFAGILVAVAGAAILAFALDALRLDPRGALVGTYVQRNALVVGFAMGFAIIPLIYTIADDALSTVPEHLRSASLGAGATAWQTAVRIVIPTAASGLFSALMIGLGRAVGETMIVLMAAGNTPVMNWNIFEGFETLSMAIATELPEAAKNSTHYRMLFLAALTLFAITFLVNTVAEIVRQRFRRRAYEL